MSLMSLTFQCNDTSHTVVCDDEGSGPSAVITIPCLLCVSTLVIVCVIVWSLFRKRGALGTTFSSHSRAGAETLGLTTVSGALSVGQRALVPWEIPARCDLEEVRFFRTGHYGHICKGLLRGEGTTTAVVIKTLRDGSNLVEAEEFVDLALFYATVCKHENLVQMLFCQTLRLPMYLLLEASCPGNLLHLLWAQLNGSGTLVSLQPFSESEVYLVAKQVAAGLDYLVSEHRLVNGDVAARNILIGRGFSAKVSGLGLAFEGRRMGRVARQRADRVPLKWQAPERMMGLPVTASSDVWSFGILLFEMITLGSPPFPDLEPSEVLPQLQKAYRMKRPEQCGLALYDLMKYCWMWNFRDRPAFSQVIKLLESYQCLAETKPLCGKEHIDVCQYNRRAGLPH